MTLNAANAKFAMSFHRPDPAWFASALILTILLAMPLQLQARELLVPKGSDWVYNDGENPPTDDAWITPAFDESSWKPGIAPFGYGGLGAHTWIANTSNPRPVTAYFRTTFHVDDPSELENLEA